ncbi:AbrB/MazE/SpoVT family DNA-binding domain-containing protein [Carboxydothermus pertinax]|uniref:Transcriptional regulator, AbrB family n=1 Tax=Carboxydothermus pertinax TaxID=870242 RepID=A0A1L8CV25_9THEO|nr:AbrB/MazE/SpoVT family DNA-binding domain-containing protein [Carboxydothermus pertinax]GAV22751.1 Transcriptional regulator, AbrB family [Carboxydothermus pertinax]
MGKTIIQLGKRGTIVIPAEIRKKLNLKEGSYLIAEETKEGLLLKPAEIYEVEIYSNERKAEFLLANAVSEEDRMWAYGEIRKMGLNPEEIEANLKSHG